YIIFACLMYFVFALVNHARGKSVFTFLNSNIMLWLFGFATIYILSNEVIIHGLKFTPQLVDVNELNTSYPRASQDIYYYGDYERMGFITSEFHVLKRQLIKIGYPMLWGILSFVFLIIGIRRQVKQLRIIALSLLGITIVK